MCTSPAIPAISFSGGFCPLWNCNKFFKVPCSQFWKVAMQPSCHHLTCLVLYQIFDQYHCDFWKALTISKLRQIDEMNCCFNKSCQTDPAEYASFSELLMFTPLLKSFTVSVQRVVRWTFQRYILELALSKQFLSDPWLIIAHGCQPECVEIRMMWHTVTTN